MFSSFLFYGIFHKNGCSSCSILVDIAIFISSSLLLYQLLSNQESRTHSVDTSSRKGFKCKRVVTEVLEGLEAQKEGKRVSVEEQEGERSLLPKDQGAAFGLEPRSLHSQASADCGCYCWRHIAGTQKPALRWCC